MENTTEEILETPVVVEETTEEEEVSAPVAEEVIEA